MKFSLTVVFCLFMSAVYTQDGSIDSTFGTNGRVYQYPILELANYEGQIKIQSDGKIVQVGSVFTGDHRYDFAVSRYTINGTVDSSFGTNGIVITDFGLGRNDHAHSIAIQEDGKIVVAGRSQQNTTTSELAYKFAVARYNTDGSLDNSFNGTGKVITSLGDKHDFARSVIIQADGKIMVGGMSDQGDIFESDYDFGMVRYNRDGTLDNSFGTLGKVTTAFITHQNDGINDIVLQPDGKIIAAGHRTESAAAFKGDFALVRYNVNGTLDNSFGVSGKVTTSYSPFQDGAISLDIQTDGKIVVAGEGNLTDPFGRATCIISRYNSNGTIDNTFNGTGSVFKMMGTLAGNYSEVIVQPDNKILITGASTDEPGKPDFFVLRYNNNGTPDNSFGTNGVALLEIGGGFDYSFSVAMQGQKIIVGGNSNLSDNRRYFSVVRLKNTIAGFCNITLDTVVSNIKCNGANNGSINLTVSGGTSPYQFLWSNNATTEDLNNLAPGNYKVIATDFLGCTDSITTIAVTQPSILQVSETHGDLTCHPNSTTSIALNASGGTLPYTYLWNDGTTNTSLSNAGPGTYSVEVTDANLCKQTITVGISLPASCLKKSIVVYPNPTHGPLKIRFKGYKETVRVVIYDAMGKPYKEQLISVISPMVADIPTKYLANGVYEIVIFTAEEKIVTKFIKL